MRLTDIQQVYETFLDMEERQGLFQRLEVNHIKVWHYIRFEIYDIIAHAHGMIRNTNLEKKGYKEQKGVLDWIDANLFRNQFISGKRDVLVFNHTRRVRQGKYYKCIYTDEWLKNFDKSYCVYEYPYEMKFHFKPVYTKNLHYVDLEKYGRPFYRKLQEGTYAAEAKRVCDELLEILEEEFEIELNHEDKKRILTSIKEKVNAREVYRSYYTRLLKKINPQIVMCVVGYTFENMILSEVAKELGIPSVEIEHGHIAGGHIAYNFKNIHDLNSFPDYLFVCGEHETDAMKRLPIPMEHVYITGSAELDSKVDYYESRLNRKKKRRIVTILSGGEYELADLALELYQRLNPDEYKIYLKLHPSEYKTWKQKYKKLADSKHNIYYYLAASDFVIGIDSTSLFEATRFKCNIMILKKCWYVRSESLIQAGQAVYVDSAAEAAEKIVGTNGSKVVSDYFYCRNSSRLIDQAVDDVIRKRGKNNA